MPVAEQSFDAQRRHHPAVRRPAADDPAAFLELADVFPETLRDDGVFRAAFVDAYRRIEARGPLEAMVG